MPQKSALRVFRSRFGLALAPNEPMKELHWIGPDGAGNHQKFDHIEPSLAAFILRDERLVFPEPLGERLLRQACLRRAAIIRSQNASWAGE